MTSSQNKLERTYRYRIYPTRRQVDALNGQLAFACDLWNAALEHRIWAYRTWGARVGPAEQQRSLTELRKDGPEMNYVTQEMVLQRLQLAFDSFFRRLKAGEAPGFPRFKAKQRYNTLSWRRSHGGAAVKGDRLYIQGVGHIRVKWHRDLPSEPKQTRITRKNGRWYVALSVEVEPKPRPKTGLSVGVDVGVRQFVSLSTGEQVAGPRCFKASRPAIRRAQRRVARRQRGSRRRAKAVQQLARVREREANRRKDFAHKLARYLVDDFDLIAVENLQIRNMVRGNRGLNREINDAGWGMFSSELRAKAESAGVEVVAVDPRNTSRTCAECGVVDAASRRAELFACTGCGHEADADVNAARNILGRSGPSGANERQVASVA